MNINREMLKKWFHHIFKILQMLRTIVLLTVTMTAQQQKIIIRYRQEILISSMNKIRIAWNRSKLNIIKGFKVFYCCFF